MITKKWRVSPDITAKGGRIWLGPGASGTGIHLGSLAETVSGKAPAVWLSTRKEHVVAVVGKRGSGKSFTLGVIAEGLAASNASPLAEGSSNRAVLFFDPLDVYWTSRYPVAESDNEEASRHFRLAEAAGITGGTFDVAAWVPGERNRRAADPEWFRTLQLPCHELGLDEWELLLGVNMMTDTMGQAFADALGLVSDSGYEISGEHVPAKDAFELSDARAALAAPDLVTAYHRETLRALRQRIRSLERTGLFSADGTSLGDLLHAGRVSVVMLGRLTQSYRAAVVAVMTRMLIDRRNDAAFLEKRFALDPELQESERTFLEAGRAEGVPRTVVMLDEAQSFLAPGETPGARKMFVRLVKEGRNMGLSAILATQQPSAIDPRILSQVETFISHQLVTAPDIRAVKENLKAALPDRIKSGGTELELAALLRQLGPGSALVSAADVDCIPRRSLVIAVRPRATVHGGIEL